MWRLIINFKKYKNFFDSHLIQISWKIFPASQYILPHPWIGECQGKETFLAPSADKQTRNYDTECSNHHLSLSTLN